MQIAVLQNRDSTLASLLGDLGQPHLVKRYGHDRTLRHFDWPPLLALSPFSTSRLEASRHARRKQTYSTAKTFAVAMATCSLLHGHTDLIQDAASTTQDANKPTVLPSSPPMRADEIVPVLSVQCTE